MLSDMEGEARGGGGEKKEYFRERLLCRAIKMPSGATIRLPFHLVFHLRCNLCGCIVFPSATSTKNKKGINLCLNSHSGSRLFLL